MCLALGYATPAKLLRELNARDIVEWQAYCELEPFGQDRGDAPAAIIAHTIAAVNGAKDTRPADFLPRFGNEASTPESGKTMLAKARGFAARYKAFAKRGSA